MAYANKLFQYMSLGLPVLVSDAIAQKRIVETNKTGLVHRDKDSIDFSKKVIELYRNKVLYREYAQNAENFIKDRFNWEITSKNLVKLYNDL
jgi:glycosyltransferase involved in cell wall biosynthesis